MRARIATCCLILLTSLRSLLAAEEITIPMPKGGAWARYYVTTTREPGSAIETSPRTETIRFAGTVESDGQTHHWLEQSFALNDGRTNLMKTRVSEKDLKSDWPLADNRRWWHKGGNQPATECETFGPEYGVFSLVLPGPYSTAKTIHEARRVDYQRGRLEINEALAGRQEFTSKNDEHDLGFEMNFTVWRHPDVPVGLAAARISLRTKENGRVNPNKTYRVEFVLEDCGNDAKSAFPENN
jgi:hypothetical protein